MDFHGENIEGEVLYEDGDVIVTDREIGIYKWSTVTSVSVEDVVGVDTFLASKLKIPFTNVHAFAKFFVSIQTEEKKLLVPYNRSDPVKEIESAINEVLDK